MISFFVFSVLDLLCGECSKLLLIFFMLDSVNRILVCLESDMVGECWIISSKDNVHMRSSGIWNSFENSVFDDQVLKAQKILFLGLSSSIFFAIRNKLWGLRHCHLLRFLPPLIASTLMRKSPVLVLSCLKKCSLQILRKVPCDTEMDIARLIRCQAADWSDRLQARVFRVKKWSCSRASFWF